MKRMNTLQHRINQFIGTASALALCIGMSQASAQDEIIRGDIPDMPEMQWVPEPEGIQVEQFASDLEVVWNIRFAPDERMWVCLLYTSPSPRD